MVDYLTYSASTGQSASWLQGVVGLLVLIIAIAASVGLGLIVGYQERHWFRNNPSLKPVELNNLPCNKNCHS